MKLDKKRTNQKMTKKEAIEILEYAHPYVLITRDNDRINDAIQMAYEALKQQAAEEEKECSKES